MPDMTCVRCQGTYAPQLIDFRADGAVCRQCIIAEEANPEAIAKSEKALLRSIGRRQVAVGGVMLAIGIAVLALGASGGGSLMVVPVGLLLGGLVELGRGYVNLS